MASRLSIGTRQAAAVMFVLLSLSGLNFLFRIWITYSLALRHIGKTHREHFETEILGFLEGFKPSFFDAFQPQKAWSFSGHAGPWILIASVVFLFWWSSERTQGHSKPLAVGILTFIPALVGLFLVSNRMREGFETLAHAGITRADMVGIMAGESFGALILGLYSTASIWCIIGLVSFRERRSNRRKELGLLREERPAE